MIRPEKISEKISICRSPDTIACVSLTFHAKATKADCAAEERFSNTFNSLSVNDSSPIPKKGHLMSYVFLHAISSCKVVRDIALLGWRSLSMVSGSF